MEPTPLPEVDQICAKITQMQSEMIANNPHFEFMLREIHTRLHKNPDLVHLLNEEDIGKIVSCLAKKENTVIGGALAGAKKGKLADGRDLKQMTLDDI